MGKVYPDGKSGRWYIQLPAPYNVRIFVDKLHKTFYSKQHAADVLGEIRAEIRDKTFDPAFYSKRKKSIQSFEVYAEQWLRNQEIRFSRQEISPLYIKDLRRWVNKLWIPFFGPLNIREIKGQHLKQFYLSVERHPKTIYNIMGGLHRLFRDAFDEEVISKIPKFPLDFKAASLPDPRWQWADVDVQDAIFAGLSPELFYFCYFLATHGCRPSEARALQYRDINLQTMQVTFQRTFSGETLREFTKSKRIRTVPLDLSWVEMFQKQPRFIGSAFIFTHEGLPLTEKFARHKWRKAAKRAGYPSLTLYQGTRHSFASQARNRGISLSLISEFLGHSTLEQTRRKYAHLRTDTLKVVQRQGTVIELRKQETEKARQ